MNKHTQKIIYLVIAAVCISIVVYLLFPVGNSLVQKVRLMNSGVYEIPHGPEIIYTFIDRGDIEVANNILQNNYELSRFEPVKIENITWEEDPFNDIYWRFNFYNLEPVRHLLYAWGITNEQKYKDKLITITDSFINNGMDSQYAWDLHGVAFRTLTLVDVYWKLRNANEFESETLPSDFHANMLAILERHGMFLAEPQNYEGAYNHGLDQSVALYVLARTFPELPESSEWEKLASSRISVLLDTIVDDDGVLVENSPYYHFYVLEKIWEINQYLETYDLYISDDFEEKLDKMISYGAYILQPNNEVPTIGASLKGKIQLAKIYTDMASKHPDLLYVLTNGKRGARPDRTNIHYPESGQTIMRSGWGRNNDYKDETQLIFDAGGYRTNHSDLDALSFHLYSKGLALMPDTGLYTYDPGPYRSYFHGTKAHNTVVVDGLDQSTNSLGNGGGDGVYTGPLVEGDGYVHQTGTHELYEGVTHTRAVTLIEDDIVLIFDDLTSETSHVYEQMFHLSPEADINIKGMTVTAKGATPEQTLTIQQFATDGMQLAPLLNTSDPLDGICSFEYTVSIPCYSLAYTQTGDNVSYVTAISIGDTPAEIVFNQDDNTMTVTTNKHTYDIAIAKTEQQEQQIDVDKQFSIQDIYNSKQPVSVLNEAKDWLLKTNTNNLDGEPITTLSVQPGTQLSVTAPRDGSYLEVKKTVLLDLSNQDLYFKVRVFNANALDGIDIYLSNDNWKTQARYNVTNSPYDVNREGEWIQFGAHKSAVRSRNSGAWILDPLFNWSRVDGIKFIIANKPGGLANVTFKDFALIKDQANPQAVFVFDDGWQSVSAAAEIMKEHNFKGNVAVITDSVDSNRYLTLSELKNLQNNEGWDIVNHTSLHKDAVVDYSNKDNIDGYEADLTNALAYLITHDLNSAPNWMVYPYGKTNGEIKEVVGKYYKFARATTNGPESFPFAEPLEVRALSIYSDRITTANVKTVLQDTLRYNQTVMFMFHKFTEAPPDEYHQWQLSEFKAIIEAVEELEIPVVTLSELDAINGVPETEFTLHQYKPEQYQLSVTTTPNSYVSIWWSTIQGWFNHQASVR